MQGCDSPYVGDDVLSYRIPGPPTIAIRCHWKPGASGGGWLIDEGTRINGLTSYGKQDDKRHTFGPYFSARNVGRLTRPPPPLRVRGRIVPARRESDRDAR